MNKLTVLISAALIAGGAFAATYTYTGGNPYDGTDWNNDWNGVTDKANSSRYLWSSHAAPASGNDYVIDNAEWYTQFVIENDSSDRFKGDSLAISRKEVGVTARYHNCRLTVNNLTLNAGSLLRMYTEVGFNGYDDSPYGLSLTGTPQIDGTLRFYHKKVVDYYNNFGGYLSGNLTGQGTIELCGDDTKKRSGPNWRINGDNSGFSGKFVFQLGEAINGGETYATGVEITSANALGGARDSFTPNAVEIKSWNGLVTVGSDITLNAANSGILMQTNSFFEVPANRVLTVAEPIRMTGGFFKKGAGTLALTGGFTFGSNGSASADGVNSALTVKEGILRVTQANELANIDVSMANGTTLELAGATTTTATFRSLSAAGVLKVAVDCTGLTPGSTQTVTLNMPRSDAEALIGKIDVMAKGSYATIGSDLTLTSTGMAATLKVPPAMTWHNYTGSTGYGNYNTSWNDQIDGDNSSKYLWDSNAAAVSTDGYAISLTVLFNVRNVKFNGGALRVKANGTSVNMTGNYLEVSRLTVDEGAYFRAQCDYDASGRPKPLQGVLWRIDGTLELAPVGTYGKGYLCPTVPMIGSGLVSYGGWGWSTKSLDQRLESDNSLFRGKFKVALHKTSEGADKAAGLRIVDARALGGALGVMTPDALTLEANNGLIAGQTLTLDAENRGILMKHGAYFEVESGKTLTLKEPIRAVNGILKKGSGTLAIGGDVTFGEDGATSPDGTNNKLTVQAGTIKAGSTNGIAKLAFDFASGTKMEVDAFPSDEGAATAGFYLAGDTPFTIADAKIPLNVAFPEGYKVEADVNVILCTVKSANVATVTNKLSVTATGLAHRSLRSLWTEDAGNGLTRIGYKFERSGICLILK